MCLCYLLQPSRSFILNGIGQGYRDGVMLTHYQLGHLEHPCISHPLVSTPHFAVVYDPEMKGAYVGLCLGLAAV